MANAAFTRRKFSAKSSTSKPATPAPSSGATPAADRAVPSQSKGITLVVDTGTAVSLGLAGAAAMGASIYAGIQAHQNEKAVKGLKADQEKALKAEKEVLKAQADSVKDKAESVEKSLKAQADSVKDKAESMEKSLKALADSVKDKADSVNDKADAVSHQMWLSKVGPYAAAAAAGGIGIAAWMRPR